MVDNAIALGIRAPEMQSFNPLQAMLVASQLRSAENQNALTQMQIGERQTQATALEQYRTRLGANDPKADEALAGTPDLLAKVVSTRAAMNEDQRKTLDDNLLRNAQSAQKVLNLPADQRVSAWNEELDTALKERRINQLEYARMKNTTPDEKVLSSVVKAGLSIENQITLEQKEKDRAAGVEFIKGAATLFGGAKPPDTVPAGGGQTPSYFTVLKTAESGGDPSARPIDAATGKPASTAAGLFQFTKGTWNDVATKYPDLGLKPEDRVGTDPEAIAKQEKAVKALTAENASALVKNEIAPTDRNLYLAHFLGGDGAVDFLRGMAKNPNGPATDFVSKEAVEANKSVFFDKAGMPKTVLGVYNSLTNKFANSNTVATGTAASGTGNAGMTIGGVPAQNLIPFLMAGAGTPGLPKESRELSMELLKTVLAESKPSDFQKKYLQYYKQETDAGRVPKGIFDYEVALSDKEPNDKFGVIGKDKNGNDVHGFIDIANKKVFGPDGKEIDPKTLASTEASPHSDLTGPAFLEAMAATDPGRANQIKAIADGRMSPPGGMSLKSPQIQALMRDVAQYEPGFDLTTWKARESTRKDLSSGKMGQNVTAFNTAIGHLETLDKAAEGLGNRWSPMWNTVANMAETAAGDPRVKKFEVARTAVADELTRAFRGSGGNVHDLIQWENAINSSGSPPQLKAAIKQAVELLRSRIEAVGDQYSRGMGKTTDPLELLNPKAKAGILRLSGEMSPEADTKTPGGTADIKPPTGFTLVQ